jgi:hypothetical protein
MLTEIFHVGRWGCSLFVPLFFFSVSDGLLTSGGFFGPHRVICLLIRIYQNPIVMEMGEGNVGVGRGRV